MTHASRTRPPRHESACFTPGRARARVSKDGQQLREMGTGDSFGEIALLRQVPRTATVTAVSRLQARTLAREEFLAAVTGDAESAEGADQVISARLEVG